MIEVTKNKLNPKLDIVNNRNPIPVYRSYLAICFSRLFRFDGGLRWVSLFYVYITILHLWRPRKIFRHAHLFRCRSRQIVNTTNSSLQA